MPFTPRPIITLTTDFGHKDGYVGAMYGVILSICPVAMLVTISHDIPPQDIHSAAFVLYQAFSYYPANTIHCAVVDPGVGSNRRAIAVRTSHGFFVGPDNGIFSLVFTAEPVNVLEAVVLTNLDYHLSSVSSTFHGRDIFAPAAAHLANGVPLGKLGPRAINLVRLETGPKLQATPQTNSPSQECKIIHVDHFGNLILSLTRQDIADPEHIIFRIGNKTIRSLGTTYTDVAEGELLAYTGSSRDHIEIGIRNGNAAQQLGLKNGDIVWIESEAE